MTPDGEFARGGTRLIGWIDRRIARMGEGAELKVGFLKDARYPDGTSIAYVAAINEYGGSWPMPERDATIYRSVSERTGDFLKGGRFVKKSKSNFATTHRAKSYTHTQPPRPFFRTMIAENKAGWGEQTAKLLRKTDFDGALTLDQMGFEIEGQLQDSIKKLTSPPLAASTVRRKGFDKPLIGGSQDSGGGGLMWQSTGHEIVRAE